MYVLMIDVCVDHALSFARRRACHLKVFTRSHFCGPLFAVHMFTFHSLAVGRCVQRGEEPVMGRRRPRKGKTVTLTFLGHYADSSPFPVLRSSWSPYSDLTRCKRWCAADRCALVPSFPERPGVRVRTSPAPRTAVLEEIGHDFVCGNLLEFTSQTSNRPKSLDKIPILHVLLG